jgi:hypothetical protein
MRLIKGRAKGDLVPVGQLQKLLTTMGEVLSQQEALALCQEADPTSSVCTCACTFVSHWLAYIIRTHWLAYITITVSHCQCVKQCAV